MRWLVEQTGLNARDLPTFTGEQAFTCGHTRFLRLLPARNDGHRDIDPGLDVRSRQRPVLKRHGIAVRWAKNLAASVLNWAEECMVRTFSDRRKSKEERTMRIDFYTKAVLSVIAVSLLYIALGAPSI